MSIPASIVVSKLRYPEVEETTSSEKLSLASVEDARESAGNWMHAFTNGAWLGVRLAGIVVAVLACVIAGVDLIDAVLTWAGSYLNIEDLTLELIFGHLFVPIAFFLGIPNRELVLVGRLIAVKFLKVSTHSSPERGSALYSDTLSTERVPSLRATTVQLRLLSPHGPLAHHLHLRTLWLRQPRVPGDASRADDTNGPVAQQGHCQCGL